LIAFTYIINGGKGARAHFIINNNIILVDLMPGRRSEIRFILFIGASAVTAAGVGTSRIRQALVPTFAVGGALLGDSAFSGAVVEDLTFHASKLFNVLAEVAGDELLTTGRVRETGVSQFLPMRSQDILLGTKKAFNVLFDFLHCAFFCVNGTLLRSDARSLGLVENEACGARKLMGFAIDAVIEFITHFRVLVVEEPVGSVTQWVDPGFRLLDIFAIAAFHVERVVALFLVRVAVLEKQSVGTELSFRRVVDALVVQITLLRVGKEPVLLWTPEGWSVVWFLGLN